MNLRRYQVWLIVGAALGCLAVVLGAFGAHGLKSALVNAQPARQWSDAQVTGMLANWETAAQYQMYHALALLAVGLLAAQRCTRAIHLAGAAFTLGVLIFSGCLYALVLSGQRWLGAIVPIGGMLLILGWVCLLIAVLQLQDVEPPSAIGRHVE